MSFQQKYSVDILFFDSCIYDRKIKWEKEQNKTREKLENYVN